MKKQNILTGLIIMAIGIYFLLKTFNTPYLNTFNSWPTLLIIIGVAFFIYSYFSKDNNDTIFFGILLLGLGIHFHFSNRIEWWPSGWAVYTLILGIAFLGRYYKTRKEGFVPGIILLILSLLAFFYKGFQVLASQVTSFVGNLWPVLLIALGLYLIFARKK